MFLCERCLCLACLGAPGLTYLLAQTPAVARQRPARRAPVCSLPVLVRWPGWSQMRLFFSQSPIVDGEVSEPRNKQPAREAIWGIVGR